MRHVFAVCPHGIFCRMDGQHVVGDIHRGHYYVPEHAPPNIREDSGVNCPDSFSIEYMVHRSIYIKR